MGEAAFRVISQWGSGPDVAGEKWTLVEDLLCARHYALLVPYRGDFSTLPETAIASSSPLWEPG